VLLVLRETLYHVTHLQTFKLVVIEVLLHKDDLVKFGVLSDVYRFFISVLPT
jgi:hypothetical protein